MAGSKSWVLFPLLPCIDKTKDTIVDPKAIWIDGLNGKTRLDFVFLAVFHILGKERCFDNPRSLMFFEGKYIEPKLI